MFYKYSVSTEDGYHITMLCDENGDAGYPEEHADKWDPTTFMPQDIVFDNRDELLQWVAEYIVDGLIVTFTREIIN